jgi:hypothetical protein
VSSRPAGSNLEQEDYKASQHAGAYPRFRLLLNEGSLDDDLLTIEGNRL